MIFQRLKALLNPNKSTRSVALIAAGTMLGQGVMLLSLPLLTRLYTPDTFGLMAVFLGVLVPLNAVASLRYEVAIALPRDESTAQKLLVIALVLVLVFTSVLGLVVYSVAPDLLRGTDLAALIPFLWLLPVSFLGGGLYHALSYYAIRQQRFGAIAWSKVTQGVGQASAQVGLGLLGLGLGGLLVGIVVRFWGGTGALLKQLWREMKSWSWRPERRDLLRIMTTYRRFPLLSSWATLIQVGSTHLPAIMLAVLYGPLAAGWFSLGQRVLEAPITLLAKSASQVYIGEASATIRQRPDNLHDLYKTTLWRQLKLGLPLMVFVMLPAPWIFPLVFGNDWQTTGVYVQLLSLMFLLQFLAQTVGIETLTLLEHQGWHLLIEATRIGIFIVLFATAYIVGFSDVVFVALLGAVAAFAYFVYLWAAWQLSHRVARSR